MDDEDSIDGAALIEAAERLQRDFGLALPPMAMPRLRRALSNASTIDARTSVSGLSAFMRALIDGTTVRESYLLRHPEQLAAVLAHLLGLRGPGRVWSAACARGEEPLSVALLMREAVGDQADDRIEIIGSDISETALEFARAGRLRPWSLRTLSAERRERYFQEHVREGGPTSWLTASPSLTSLTSYRWLNLADPDARWPADLDVVLLRNVLLYFTPEAITSVLARMVSVLKPGGLLMVAPAESPLVGEPWRAVKGAPGVFELPSIVVAKVAAPQERPVVPEVVEPPSVEPWQAQVHTMLAERRFREADSLLDQTITANPLDASAHFARAEVAAARGRAARAAKSLARARSLDLPAKKLDEAPIGAKQVLREAELSLARRVARAHSAEPEDHSPIVPPHEHGDAPPQIEKVQKVERNDGERDD